MRIALASPPAGLLHVAGPLVAPVVLKAGKVERQFPVNENAITSWHVKLEVENKAYGRGPQRAVRCTLQPGKHTHTRQEMSTNWSIYL